MSPPEPPGSCWLAPPSHSTSAAVLSELLGLRECQLLKGQQQGWLICPVGPHRARKTDAPDQRLSRTEREARNGFPLPEFFLALQGRPVPDKTRVRPLSPSPAAGPLRMGTPTSQLERMTLERSHRSVPIVPWTMEVVPLARVLEPQHLLCGLVSISSPLKGGGRTRQPPRPLEVLPSWNCKPRPSGPR